MDDGTGYDIDMVGSGTSLLLIHGFTGSAASWAAMIPDLLPGRRVIAVDLLGHGGSDAPPPARHAVDRQAVDIARILAGLDAAPADVLGYSFGARIALRIAIASPRSVRRLVLESPSAGLEDAVRRDGRRAADQRWVEQLQRGDLDDFVRDWSAQPIFASQGSLDPEVRERLAAIRRANRPDGLAASLLGAGQGVMAPLHGLLAAIEAPTLVITGDLDPRGSAAGADVARRIPGAVHQRLDDAGHTPHIETPGRFSHLVTAFLPTSTVSPIQIPVA